MLSVMDHLWQLDWQGDPEEEMLEAYATLGYLAAHTSRVKLLTFVTAATYREPGLLAKVVTTLDVLSGGRAWLGIGAGFYEAEATGLGLPLPPAGERFERLEEALQICLQMWSGREEPYQGRHYQLGRTLNSPQALTRPHPPILLAGGGEKKTLRLVAKYADACNIPGSPELERKLSVLRQHCDDVGRDYDEIKKTVITGLDPGPSGERADEILEQLAGWAKLGVDHVQTQVAGVFEVTPLEVFAERIIPAAARL
jgi:alkanesulfonate monooxygenase